MSKFSIEAVLKASGAGEFARGFKQAEDSMKSFDKVGKTIGDVGKTMSKMVTVPILGLATASVKLGAEYEVQMNKVRAVTGATGESFEKLDNIAKDLGANTRYSAMEAAQGIEQLGLAGWDTEQIVAAIPDVLTLATAGAMELGDAADFVSDAVGMFGLEARDAGRLADVFSSANANSAMTAGQLREALTNVGSTANASGQSVETTSALIGALANNGMKGGRAGTALSAVFRDLRGSAEDGAVAIGDASVAVYDSEGNFRNMIDIIADVEDATKGMTQEQRDMALSNVFTATTMNGLNLLLGEGSDSIRELEGTLNNAEGTAQDMADTMDEGLTGALTNLKSALEGAMLLISEHLNPIIESVVVKLNEWVTAFNNLDDETIETITKIALLVAAIGPILIVVSKVMALYSKWIILKGKLAVVTEHFGGVMKMLTSPIGLTVVAVVALIAILVALWKTNEDFRDAVMKVWGQVKEIFSTVLTFIGELVTNVIESVKAFWEENSEQILEVTSRVWEFIGSIFTGVMETISSIITEVVSFITEFWETHHETIESVSRSAWEIIGAVIETVVNVIVEVVTWFVETVSAFWSEYGDSIIEMTKIAWDFISGIYSTVFGVILGVVQWFIDLVQAYWEENGETIMTVTKAIWDIIKTVFDTVLGIIGGLVKTFVAIFSGDWDGFLEGIKGIWDSIWDGILGVITTILETIRTLLSEKMTSMRETVSNIMERIRTIFSNIWESIETRVSTVLSNIYNSIRTRITDAYNSVIAPLNNIRNIFTSIWNSVRTGVSSALSNIYNSVSSRISETYNSVIAPLNNIRNKFRDIFNGLRDTVANAFGRVKTAVYNGMVGAYNTVIGWFSSFRTAGSNIIGNIADGITGSVSKVVNAGKNAMSKLRNILPFSPPKDKTSPLADIHKNGITEQIAKGIYGGESDIDRAIREVVTLPSLDINGSVARSTSQIGSTIRHEVGRTEKSPTTINLNLGGRNYRAFVEDITGHQEGEVRLETEFGL